MGSDCFSILFTFFTKCVYLYKIPWSGKLFLKFHAKPNQSNTHAQYFSYTLIGHWVKHGMEWNGLEWNGMEWNGMVWNGMEWNGMDWNGMEFYQEHFLFISNLYPLNPTAPLTPTPIPANHDPSLDSPDLDPHPTPTLTPTLTPPPPLTPNLGLTPPRP